MKKQTKLQERRDLRNRLFNAIEEQSIDLRDALKMTRTVVGKNQAEYARLVGVSKKIIADLELGKGNPTIGTLNKLFAPIGIKIGLVQVNGKKKVPESNSDI
jgi:DNA-binding XRE family transcriptional regulator